MRLPEQTRGIPSLFKNMFAKDYTIGLDIGFSSVKLALFSTKEGVPQLVKAELKEVKHTGDKALDEKETLSAISYLLKGINVKKSKVMAAINCPQTAIKRIVAPYMPKAELLDGIRLEAKNYFPFPIEESLVDCEIQGDIVEKGIRKYELVVAVSPKATVEASLSLLAKAGIRPASFIPSSYALQKASLIGNLASDEVTCLVDIGSSNSELIICRGNSLAFTRKIPVTGNDFTIAMTGVLVSDRGRTQLTPDEAEKIKQDVGVPSETESKVIDDKISTVQILSMLRAPLEQLVHEIERCFDYYREESGGDRVDSVLLFGGGSSLGGLIKFLSEELGVKVKLGDALQGLNAERGAVREKEKLSYRLELALSAALYGMKGINLLPPEIKEGAKRVVKRGTLAVIGAAIVAVAALLFVGMKIQLGNIEKRISVAGLELSSLRLQLKKAEADALANRVLADEPQWEDVFTELSNLLPGNVHLTNLRMENNIIHMKGVVASEDGEQALANLILALEKGLFSNVKLISSKELADKAGIEFNLKCWVDYENS